MATPSILVLVRPTEGVIPRPEDTPFGRAALALHEEGICVAFGSSPRLLHAAAPGLWRQVKPEICALYDRYPSQSHPQDFARACQDFPGRPMGNPPSLTRLCRDKVECQAFLVSAGIPMPPLVFQPDQFRSAIHEWGGAYLKPRFGGLGRGISKVGRNDELPSHGEGAVKGTLEPLFLQQAIEPPAGFASIAIRWLIQRLPDGGWSLGTPVARLSETDPVANVSRGAVTIPARNLLTSSAYSRGAELVLSCAEALAKTPDGDWLIELGVDLVLDSSGMPHLIELNSRPRGHLESLAQFEPQEFEPLHLEACCRPIRRLYAQST